MIINSKAGSLADDNIPNLFRLKTAMPAGDWTATVKFSSEFPTINENFNLALFQDKELWIAASLYPDWSNIGHTQSLAVSLSKHSAVDSPSFKESLFSRPGPGPNQWNKFIADNNLTQPIYLRLRRTGHDFIASARLETSDPDAWVTVNKIASLDAPGNLVFGFVQMKQGTGQTQATINWVKIEAP